jgi:sugar phosphate permease
MEENPNSAIGKSRFFRSGGTGMFYGWWILILGAMINGVGLGITYHSFTIFFLPLKRDLGVSSAAISLLYGAARLEGGVEGPVVGYLIDRFGPRKLILIGSGLAGIGLILLSTVQDFLTFFLIYVFLVSLGANAGFFHPITTAVNKWFIRRRGIAFSVITASGNIGSMIIAPILSYIILVFGWRAGAVFAGLAILFVAVPAAFRFKNAPEDMGLNPDGLPPPPTSFRAADAAGREAGEISFTVKEALRTPRYWLLSATLSLRLLVTVALNTHFVPILVWKGMGEVGSAFLVSLLAFGSILTSLVFGWLGDRWNKALLCSLGTLPTAIAMVALILGQEDLILYFFPIGFAITMGTSSLNWALIGDLFGRHSYATLRGVMGVGYGIATFLSPIYAGLVFDRTGSYDIVLFTFAVILVVTALFFVMLRHPSAPPASHP